MSTALLLLSAAACGLIAGAAARAVARRLQVRMGFIATSRPPGVVGSIAVRYRLLEVLTAVLFAVVAAVHRHDPAKLVLGLVLVAFLVPISLIDIEHRIIPNRLTVPATVLAIALGTALDPGGEVGRLVAGVVAGAALALPSLLHPSGIGMGDAKLLAVMGLFLGASVAVAFVAAFSAGAVAGAAIMMRRGVAEGRRTAIPFGPFLALGGVAGVLVGDELVNLYLGAF